MKKNATKWLMAAALAATVSSPAMAEKWDLPMAYSGSNFHSVTGAEFAKCVPCKINIIEYNPIDGEPFQQADTDKVEKFAAFLEAKNLIVNIRRSRGKDIDAACGQLANKNKAISLENRSLKNIK